MIRLLAVDMDGTCLNRKNQISEQNMAALRRLAQSGIQIVPASGRASTCLPHQLRAAPLLFRYAITSNGARVDDVRGHCLFYRDHPDTALLSDCQTLRIGVSAHIAEHTLQGVCCR
ncbi:MAG: HAD family hydrolase [Merdibacter sp.]